MSTEPITESGMTFGPYDESRFFHIEKSAGYATLGEHIRMAEFLVLRSKNLKQVLWIVEAKSSAPRVSSTQDFDAFIAEIVEKVVNAFSLSWAGCLQRHRLLHSELPEAIRTMDLAMTDVKFDLVIKGHHDSWLPPLQDAMKKALRPTIKTWALSPNSVAVLNEELAQRYDLLYPC